ncbi:MAG: hypothetical protein LBV06_04605 [Propionibacteriaceae bacterium]|jgi:hypothetical protein|nr:hypothetical protein [Propionibacteriaceae bacterium]
MAEAKGRTLLDGRASRRHGYDLGGGSEIVIHETDSAIVGAPYWRVDGSTRFAGGSSRLAHVDSPMAGAR